MSPQLDIFAPTPEPQKAPSVPEGWRLLAPAEMKQEGDKVLMPGPFGHEWVEIIVLNENNSGPASGELAVIRKAA